MILGSGGYRGSRAHGQWRVTGQQASKAIVELANAGIVADTIDSLGDGEVYALDSDGNTIEPAIPARNLLREPCEERDSVSFVRLPGLSTALIVALSPVRPEVYLFSPLSYAVGEDFAPYMSVGDTLQDGSQSGYIVINVWHVDSFNTPAPVEWTYDAGDSGATINQLAPASVQVLGTYDQINALLQGASSGYLQISFDDAGDYAIQAQFFAASGRNILQIAPIAIYPTEHGVISSSSGTSTDHAIPRWDGTGGDKLQDSVVVVSDTGAVTGIASIDGGVVINEPGADADTRIEGDTATNLFVCDAGLDAVQIGTTVAGAIADFRSSEIVFNEPGGDRDFRVEGDTATNLFVIDAGLDTLLVGTTVPGALLALGPSFTAFNALGAAIDFRIETPSLEYMFFCHGDSSNENIALLTNTEPDWQALDRGIFVGNATTAPDTAPTAGIFTWIDTGVWRFMEGSRLTPLRVRGLIDADTTLHVDASLGNDTTGNGTSLTPWATIAKAFDYLADYAIASDVTVTILLADGTYSLTSAVTVTHPNADRISIEGTNTFDKTMSSVQSSSGSAGAWSVVVNVNNVTSVAVNDYCVFRAPSGGTNPLRLAGCHKITNVDAVNSRLTLAVKHAAAATASGAVTGTITVLKSKVPCSACSAFVLHAKTGLKNIDKLAIVGDGTTNNTYGIAISNDAETGAASPASAQASLYVGTAVGISEFYIGMFAASAVLDFNGVVSFCEVYGVFVKSYTSAIASTGFVSSGNVVGVPANASASFQSAGTTSIVTGNSFSGFFSNLGSSVQYSGKCDSNTGTGVFTTASTFFTDGGSFTNNTGNGLSFTQNTLATLTSVTSSNNGGYGVYVEAGAVVDAISVTAASNTSGTYNVTADQLQADGSFLYVDGRTGVSLQAEFEKISTADQTVTNGTLADHSELQFAVTSGEAWNVDLYCEISGNNTTGDCAISMATTGTWAAGQSHYHGIHYTGAGAITATGATAASSTTLMAASPGTTVNDGDGNARPIYMQFRFHATASGTVKIQFGQAVAAGGRTTTIHKGARLIARRIRAV